MRQFALHAEMEYPQLSKIEKGVINTTINSVHSLAVALNVPVLVLFDF
jgi:transcriptional regulator with XRE-family HTH domain